MKQWNTWLGLGMSSGSLKGTQKSFAVRPPPLSSFVLVSRASCRVMWDSSKHVQSFWVSLSSLTLRWGLTSRGCLLALPSPCQAQSLGVAEKWRRCNELADQLIRNLVFCSSLELPNRWLQIQLTSALHQFELHTWFNLLGNLDASGAISSCISTYFILVCIIEKNQHTPNALYIVQI